MNSRFRTLHTPRYQSKVFPTARWFRTVLLVTVSLWCAPVCLGAGWYQQIGGNGVDLFSVDMLDSERAMIAGAGGTIIRTTDGGDFWTLQSSFTSYDLFGISGLGNGLGLAVGAGGTILRTTDAGATWSVIRTDWVDTFRSVHLLSPQFAIAVGANAIGQPFVAISSDGGLNWDFTSFYIDSNEGSLTDVVALSSEVAFASAYLWDGRGAIVKSTDGGQTWTPALITANTVFSIDFPTADVGYASGPSGLVYRTTDGGDNWDTLSNGSGQFGFALDFVGPDTGWVIGSLSTVRRTTDFGETWQDQSPGGLDLYSVDFATPTVGTIVGIYGRILRTETAGQEPTGLEESIAGNGSLFLSSAGPNPFRGQTAVGYRLDHPASVEIEVLDPQGRSILREGLGRLAPGSYEWLWNGNGRDDAPVANGVYLCRLRAGLNGEGALKLFVLGD